MPSNPNNLNWKNLSRYSSPQGYDKSALAGTDVTDETIQNVLQTNGLTTNGVGPVTLNCGTNYVAIGNDPYSHNITIGNETGGTSVDIYAAGGGISLVSLENAVDSILIEANGGTSETIVIQSQQGTTASSINIASEAGGITLTPASGKVITMNQSAVIAYPATNGHLHASIPAGSVSGLSVTVNGKIGVATFNGEAFNNSNQTFIIDNNVAGSGGIVSMEVLGAGALAAPYISSVTWTWSTSIVINVVNSGGSTNGGFRFSFMSFN